MNRSWVVISVVLLSLVAVACGTDGGSDNSAQASDTTTPFENNTNNTNNNWAPAPDAGTTAPNPTAPSGSLQVVPGQSIGDVKIGMTMAELSALWGQPESRIGFQRLINARYISRGIEVLFSSSDRKIATPDARVRGITHTARRHTVGRTAPG